MSSYSSTTVYQLKEDNVNCLCACLYACVQQAQCLSSSEYFLKEAVDDAKNVVELIRFSSHLAHLHSGLVSFIVVLTVLACLQRPSSIGPSLQQLS